MVSIDQFDFFEKRVLIRVDYNVPLNEGLEIEDDTRIKASIPSIDKVLDGGGSVVLMSHLGRPKNGYEKKFSLRPVQKHLAELLNRDVEFSEECVGEDVVLKTQQLLPGRILLLENLRFHQGETSGDVSFSEELSKLGDVYINDAFGTSHRAHASTSIITRFFPGSKLFGVLLQGEIDNIESIMHSAKHPFTAILGGAKVAGKVEIIKQLLNKIDNLIVGGGMAFTFIKARGGSVGSSLVDDSLIELAGQLIELADEKSVHLHLPTDSIIADNFSNDATIRSAKIDEIPDGWTGLDIGPETQTIFADVIRSSRSILWNGPMGVFEMSNFEAGTKNIAFAIVDATSNGAFSLVGGGDSVSAINKLGLSEKVSYVSTGGGALLEYIEGKELPGIKAILN
ncbi:MAG TPA: phosphoglycerate kinase [Flavobacteriales bacterium]|nr:phosphoglycerate kinase [Flavobacteriales bacterium]HIO72195.1 phosphoglycerate kinase [Flavobacteriales bacterium]